MLYNQNNLRDELDDQSASQHKDRNLSGMEGQPMGGHNFGRDGKPTMGDDKDNPSRYAGNTNAYFNRVAPTEEDTANNNFKAEYQQGEPDYDAAQPVHNTPTPQETDNRQQVEETSNRQEQQAQSGSGNSARQSNEEVEHIET
jgi:hypothetical protein